MTTKHTPGPWEVSTNGKQWDVCEPGAGDMIAEVYPEHGPVAEANARLIAAAPDLLIALEDAAEWLRTGKVDGVAFDEQSIADSLQAAIRKATGETA